MSWLAGLLPFLAPVTLLTGLGIYLGFVYTYAFYGAYGFDASVLDFSSQDLLIRSLDGIYLPVTLVLAAILLTVAIGPVWRRTLLVRPRVARRVRWFLLVTGAVLIANGIVFLWRPDRTVIDFDPYVAMATSITVGCILVYAYVRTSPEADGGVSAGGRLAAGALLGIALVGVFYASSQHAQEAGRQRAILHASSLTAQADTVLYSDKDLQLVAPGVEISTSDDPASAFHFRYSGLRLVLRSGGKYLLVNRGWTPSSGVAFVVRDSPTVRLQFQR